MSANSEYLKKHGWTRCGRRKQGCMIIETWTHPNKSLNYLNQAQALLVERRFQKLVRATKREAK